MNPSKTLNNKYVPEADGPRKNKNSPHYKSKYELHMFEQRGSASHCPIIKRRTHKSFCYSTWKGKKILIRTSFFRLSPIWLVQIHKESCLITQLCIPVLNKGTKQILKLWLNQMVKHREYFVTWLSTVVWVSSLVTMQQYIAHCTASTGNNIILSTTTLIRKKEKC